MYKINVDGLKVNKSQHAIDKDAERKLSKDLHDVFFGDVSEVHFNHYELTRKVEFSRILNMDERSEYVSRGFEWKKTLHWGQLKLLLTEIEFLTLYGNKKATMVYAGAAPGIHIPYLMALFKNITFDLYDPAKFAIKPNERCTINRGLFTDEIAKTFKGKNILFCSDIRSNPDEKSVHADMQMQQKWMEIIEPDFSMVKFRLRYTNPSFTKYPMGKLYVQPFVGPTSTETRLIIKKTFDAVDVKYDELAYEQACAHTNVVTKKCLCDIDLGQEKYRKLGLDGCYDCVSMIHILNEYYNAFHRRNVNPEDVAELLASMHEKDLFNRTTRYANKQLSIIRRRLFVKCGKKNCSECSVISLVDD